MAAGMLGWADRLNWTAIVSAHSPLFLFAPNLHTPTES